MHTPPRRGRCGLLTGGRPVVSAVIPLYNKAPYIGRAIQSVLAQTEQEFEVIVVDDGSTDGGAAIVEHFADPRIRLITQENRGASAARNRGIRESWADLVAFLDADDEWYPAFLETALDLRRRYPGAGLYATAYTIYNPDGGRRVASIAAVPPTPWSGLLPNYFRSAALGEPPISSSSVAIPRGVLKETGGFAEGTGGAKMWTSGAGLRSATRSHSPGRSVRFTIPKLPAGPAQGSSLSPRTRSSPRHGKRPNAG